MNIHEIIRSAINNVNPMQPVKVLKFKGFSVDEYGINTNTYDEVETIARIQPINSFKLQHINNFNSSNVYKKAFLNGFQYGLNMALSTNGDMLEFDGKRWLIIEAPQTWSYTGWNELTLCLQNDNTNILENNPINNNGTSNI